jgi:hypothetical protein
MKTTLELWSQLAFRISAFTLAGLLVVLTAREQNRPSDADLKDAITLEKMESYLKLEKTRIQQKAQMADDQRLHATPLGIPAKGRAESASTANTASAT